MKIKTNANVRKAKQAVSCLFLGVSHLRLFSIGVERFVFIYLFTYLWGVYEIELDK